MADADQIFTEAPEEVTRYFDANTWSAHSVSTMDFKIGSISYYKHTIDGSVLYEIDLFNCVCIVDGEDQWADMRSGLGY